MGDWYGGFATLEEAKEAAEDLFADCCAERCLPAHTEVEELFDIAVLEENKDGDYNVVSTHTVLLSYYQEPTDREEHYNEKDYL